MGDAGDGRAARARFLRNGAIGEAVPHHLGDVPALRHGFEFLEGAEIPEELFALFDGLEVEYRPEEIVCFFIGVLESLFEQWRVHVSSVQGLALGTQGATQRRKSSTVFFSLREERNLVLIPHRTSLVSSKNFTALKR
jgi:hypothetical protein